MASSSNPAGTRTPTPCLVRLSPRDAMSPYAVTALMEMKTVWHPIGV